MAHYAYVENNIVERVIVAEQDVIDSGLFGDPQRWIQTSYNTKRGVHLNGGTPLRKNFAGVGFTYDSIRDAFIPPKPYESWNLNEDTCDWEPPSPIPTTEGFWQWDENNLQWVDIEQLLS